MTDRAEGRETAVGAHAGQEPGGANAGRSRSRGRRFTLGEKIAIVRESRAPGVKATHVARSHGVALNVLYYWRRAYADLADVDLTAPSGPQRHAQIADLQLQVRNLERLLGQRTLEVALLKERLGASDGEA